MDFDFNSNTFLAVAGLFSSVLSPWLIIQKGRKDNSKEQVERIVSDMWEKRNEKDAQRIREVIRTELSGGQIQVTLNQDAIDRIQFKLQGPFDGRYAFKDTLTSHCDAENKRHADLDARYIDFRNSLSVCAAGVNRLLIRFGMRMPTDADVD